MPAGVSVDTKAIQGGINCCKAAIQKLEDASAVFLQRYHKAGCGGWNDKNYTALGMIVDDCRNSLRKPISELQNCLYNLNELFRSIEEYEQISLGTLGRNSHTEASIPNSGTSYSTQVLMCSPGEYHYESGSNNTRHAYGQLNLVDKENRHRDQLAQSSAGDTRRREDDDGGHLIGARFGGSSTAENLFPQNMHLNRSGYRSLETQWAGLLNSGNQVFVNIYTSASNDQMREDTIYGSYTVISRDGRQYTEGFSFANENTETQNSWEEDVFINNLE